MGILIISVKTNAPSASLSADAEVDADNEADADKNKNALKLLTFILYYAYYNTFEDPLNEHLYKQILDTPSEKSSMSFAVTLGEMLKVINKQSESIEEDTTLNDEEVETKRKNSELIAKLSDLMAENLEVDLFEGFEIGKIRRANEDLRKTLNSFSNELSHTLDNDGSDTTISKYHKEKSKLYRLLNQEKYMYIILALKSISTNVEGHNNNLLYKLILESNEVTKAVGAPSRSPSPPRYARPQPAAAAPVSSYRSSSRTSSSPPRSPLLSPHNVSEELLDQPTPTTTYITPTATAVDDATATLQPPSQPLAVMTQTKIANMKRAYASGKQLNEQRLLPPHDVRQGNMTVPEPDEEVTVVDDAEVVAAVTAAVAGVAATAANVDAGAAEAAGSEAVMAEGSEEAVRVAAEAPAEAVVEAPAEAVVEAVTDAADDDEAAKAGKVAAWVRVAEVRAAEARARAAARARAVEEENAVMEEDVVEALSADEAEVVAAVTAAVAGVAVSAAIGMGSSSTVSATTSDE